MLELKQIIFAHLDFIFQVINEAFHKEKTIATKSALTDLVTETDQYVEKLIIGALKDKYPTHRQVDS